jgi:hypothetical protein
LAWNPYINGTQITGGSFDLSILSGATITLKITMPGSTEAGYAVIRANSRDTLTNFLEGNLTYYVDSTADSVGVAPSRPFFISALPFEDFDTICLALANTNPGGQQANITLELYSSDGLLANTQTFGLQPGGYTAQYLWQLFSSVDRSFGRGRLQISADIQISGVALTQVSNGQLSSLPLNSTVFPYSITMGSTITISGQSFTPETLALWTEGASFIHGALGARVGSSLLRYFMYGSVKDGILELLGATNSTSFVMIINVPNFQNLEQSAVNGQVTLIVPSSGSVQTSTFSATPTP